MSAISQGKEWGRIFISALELSKEVMQARLGMMRLKITSMGRDKVHFLKLGTFLSLFGKFQKKLDLDFLVASL